LTITKKTALGMEEGRGTQKLKPGLVPETRIVARKRKEKDWTETLRITNIHKSGWSCESTRQL